MRNQNGFGSIVCLDKTGKKRRKPWGVRITTGWKDGKQIRKYVGYYKTQREALIALAEYHEKNVDLDLSKMTLNDVYDKWFERVQKKDVSRSVLQLHQMTKKRFGRLGNVAIKKIKSTHLQDWMDNIDLKPGTKIKMKSTMKQLYQFAVNNDIVNKNYADAIEITDKIEKTGKIFTDEEIQTLWENTNIDEVQQLLILIYTGMRVGEMLKVNRNDINFEEGYLIGGFKTKAGTDRVIPIHHKIMPFVKQQLGNNYWLVQSNRGTARSYEVTHKKYGQLFKQLGMAHKIHDTRKTCVSWLHSSGVPMEVIRIIVGHSGKGVTEKVYLYKEPKELVEIVNKITI